MLITVWLLIASTPPLDWSRERITETAPFRACDVPNCEASQRQDAEQTARRAVLERAHLLRITSTCSAHAALSLMGWNAAVALIDSRITIDRLPAAMRATLRLDVSLGDQLMAQCTEWDRAAAAPIAIRIEESKNQRINAIFTNVSDHATSFVLPGDGSEMGWRTPHALLDVTPADDVAMKTLDAAAPWPLARCGMFGGIATSEVIQLKPGETRTEPLVWSDLPELGPGVWQVVLRYRNDPNIHDETGRVMSPSMSPSARELVAATPRFTAVTAPILITIP
jgi:hypothetical protein